jgi:hypothetical protein
MNGLKKLNIPGLSCLTEQSKDSGLFVSRCLNYNLVESGSSWKEACDNLKIVMKNHIEYWAPRKPEMLENDRQADRKLWDKFFQLIKDNGAIVDQITLEIPEPSPEGHEEIWILGPSQEAIIHDHSVPDVQVC